jgi:hypothetical protein
MVGNPLTWYLRSRMRWIGNTKIAPGTGGWNPGAFAYSPKDTPKTSQLSEE